MATKKPKPKAAIPMGDCCATCRYSLPAGVTNDSKPQFLCRRYPPQIGMTGACSFPMMLLEGWCGEFARPEVTT